MPTDGAQQAGRRRTERLDKLVAEAGIGSRRDVRRWIRAGRVTVDGKPALDPARPVAAGESVEFDGETLVTGSVTLMVNKPKGLVTAMRDARHDTVADLLPPAWARRLFPAGRLDKDTEGLLILTDDGELCHRIISPRHGVEKEYVATVDGPVPHHLPEAFAAGVTLDDGYTTRPAQAHIVRPRGPGIVRVVIAEGKYHQVRRMFAAMGLHVRDLKRIRIGSLALDPSLAPGAFRRVKPEEMPLLLTNPD